MLKKVCKIHLSQNLNNDLVFIGNVTLPPEIISKDKSRISPDANTAFIFFK